MLYDYSILQYCYVQKYKILQMQKNTNRGQYQ